MRRITILVALATAALNGAAAAQERALTIHGYLTQAFGISDGGTMLGVPTTGTTDYRNAALQFRYAFSANDHATIQLSHQRLGEDIATAGRPPVELDWAFYGHNFSDVTVKVGRVPIPSGILNEVRDVGTLLPLYRAPFVFYLEGAFTSETVDGAVATWQIGDPMSWGVELSGFAGGWNMIERFVDNTGTVLSQNTRIEKGWGAQAWLTSPLQGVRIGGGLSGYTAPSTAFVAGLWHEGHVSLDAVLSRVTLRSEARRISTGDFTYGAWYAYAGVRPVQRLTLHAQVERSDLDFPPVPQLDFHDDDIIGASWAFRQNLVLKVEAHRTEGYWAEDPAVRIGIDQARKVSYGLISLSASF